MKLLPVVPILALLAAPLAAQTPDPSGAWSLGVFDLGYTVAADGAVVWGSSDLAIEDLTISADGTLAVPGRTGRWFFSGDLLHAVVGEVQSIPITFPLDTIAFANGGRIPDGGGNFFESVNFQAAVRLPNADFTRADVAGTWTILRQTSVSFSDPSVGAVGYNAVIHSRDTAQLHASGTFSLNPEATTDPGGLEAPFSGVWSVPGRMVRISAGGESRDFANISQGLDTVTDFQSEISVQGTNTNYDRKVEFWVKAPVSLTEADLVGRWGATVLTIDVDDDTPAFEQEFRGASYEIGYLELGPGGTGTFRRIKSSDTSLPRREALGWQVDGSRLVIVDPAGQSLDAYVSAQKDFAVILHVEDVPGGNSDAYDLITLCKLPDAPGFASARPRLETGGTVRACIPTEIGLFYQLERSFDLVSWATVGDPVAGDGTELCVTDPSPLPGRAFYRWAVVPPPTP